MNNKENGKLIYIAIEELYHHPDNPRKALGDLEELTDSIKKNGVLQNLTVVRRPIDCEGGYYVVIGNRRMEAAKAAGLKELPCIVADMTLQEQVSTMLVENMQRSDLTVYEQAQGFQMMLDFGDSIESIAEKSGFSQSTIRRRVKLLELDQRALEAADKRGATLQDYMELDKIKDPAKKNEVLRAIGTSNFEWKLKEAIDNEKKEERIKKAEAFFSKFAQKVKNQGGLRYVTSYSLQVDLPEGIKMPKDAGSTPYYYCITSWNQVYLLKDPPATKEEDHNEAVAAAAQEKRERDEARKCALKEAGKRARELRSKFVEEISQQKAKAHLSEMIAFLAWDIAENYFVPDWAEGVKILKIETYDTEEINDLVHAEDVKKAVAEAPERTLLRLIAILDDEGADYIDYWGKYESNRWLDHYYQFLEGFGYTISDEEKMLCNGTHPLFEEDA